MAVTSYSSLKSEVADWLDRSDINNAIDTFIDAAEADIYRTLRVRDMESALSVTISSGVAALPSNFLEIKYAYIDQADAIALEFRSADWIIQKYPQRSSSGRPVFAAVDGGNLIFGPYPDSTYTVKGTYYARPTALSTSNETNWLTSEHPDLLLYGALLHSSSYLGHDERMPLWQQQYDRALDDVKRQERGDRFPMRSALAAMPA